MELKHLAGIAAFLSLFESALILMGMLAPVATYSPGNVVFLIARSIIILYSGWIVSKSGIKQAARNGIVIASASTMVFILASIFGFLIRTPLLGMEMNANPIAIGIMLIAVLIANIILDAILASIAAFIAGFIKKS